MLGRFTLDLDPFDRGLVNCFVDKWCVWWFMKNQTFVQCTLAFKLVLTTGCQNLCPMTPFKMTQSPDLARWANMGPLDLVMLRFSTSSHQGLIYQDFGPHGFKPIPMLKGTKIPYPAPVDLAEGYEVSQVVSEPGQLVLDFLYQLVSFEWIRLDKKAKAELFLEQLNDIYDTLHYDDAKKVTFATFRLRRARKDWWLRISEARIIRNQLWTWDEFQEEFKQEYIARWVREYCDDEFQQLK
ncbi:hypothetical protein M9H77_17546 [Catharanthus roseus]|uniref:Uncharacterized protein n=1 Tax=Catharanthus roseus TaxID=4058 RepID=A0ACC0B4Z0_CATRO|nr:hypothetical protein M9H77_17546 [Catharanthus roseus]